MDNRRARGKEVIVRNIIQYSRLKILRQKCWSLLLVFTCKIETNTREFTIRFVIHLVLSSSVFHFLLREIWLRRQKHTDIPENAGCYFHHWSWNMFRFLILGWFKEGGFFLFFFFLNTWWYLKCIVADCKALHTWLMHLCQHNWLITLMR